MKIETSEYEATLYCNGCDFWSRPIDEVNVEGPIVTPGLPNSCPQCKERLELTIGKYQIQPVIKTWYGRTLEKKRYVGFIKKPIIEEPRIGDISEIEEEGSGAEPILEEAGIVTKPEEESGARLGEMLTMFTGEEEVDEEIFHPDIPAEKVGVHSSHCCIVHGCKYGNRNCPVVLGEVKQEYICEECDISEGWTSLSEVETHVREQLNGILPYISAEKFEKLYGKDTAKAGTGEIYENCAKYQDRIAEDATANLSEADYEFENGLTRSQQACFEKYRNITSATVLDKLHFIEGMRVIYDIHYCALGVGIVFYNKAQDKGDHRSGLSIEDYYESFDDCIIYEAKKIYESRMSWLR